jgi:hypothetical protein
MPAPIKTQILSLRKRLRAALGKEADLCLIDMSLRSKIESLVLEQVHGTIESYGLNDLAEALVVNRELEASEKQGA